MSRNFTIPMDESRLRGTIYVTDGYMPTINENVGTLSGFLPTINIVNSYEVNIPFVHQVACSISLKFTNYSYNIVNGGTQ